MRPERRTSSALRRHVSFAAAAIVLSACSWFTDFKQQPKVDPWESVSDTVAMRGNPQGSVPISGTIAPGFAYGRAPTHGAVDSMGVIRNPIASDQRSMENGRLQYAINCAVCHGDRGMGDGPVTKFGLPVLQIGSGTKAATELNDGVIFGIIRNGRGLMPSYNRIEENDRWDLINYLRAIQSGAANVPVGAVGRPGETGTLVPGATHAAPTRPAPFYPPSAVTATPPAAAPAQTPPPTLTPRRP